MSPGVFQAASKTNDTAGDGTTTATILSAAIIAEGMKIVAAGTNPVQLCRGIETTVAALVKDLQAMSTDVTDADLANVATVSAGGNEVVSSLSAFVHLASQTCCISSLVCQHLDEALLSADPAMQTLRCSVVEPHKLACTDAMNAWWWLTRCAVVDWAADQRCHGSCWPARRGDHGRVQDS